MGLDKGEIALEIEGAFGISFQDEDQETMRTIGDIYSFVLQRLEEKQHKWNNTNAEIEPKQKVKEALKKFTQDTLEPHTKLENIVPQKNRQKVWQDLLTTLDIQGPQLCLPENLEQRKASGCFMIAVVSIFLIVYLGWWIIILSALVTHIYVDSFAPYYVKIPERCANIEKLIKYVRIAHYGPKDKEEVLQIILTIIEKYSDVPVSELTLDTSLDRDLGLD